MKVARGLEAAGAERVATAAAAIEQTQAQPVEVALDGSAADWVNEAYLLPSRVACQFAVYPLGTSDYMESIGAITDAARSSPAFQSSRHAHFGTLLEGEGTEVFDVLQQSFVLACERSSHVVLTATLAATSYARERGA